ncbi:hypothetical protein TMatcc_003495 [Talaromyces marneffei ATCC 18224]
MVITRALTVIIHQGHLIITHQHPKLRLLILPDGSDCATAKFRLENFQYLFRLTEGDIYVEVSCGERGSKGLGWNRNAGIPRSMTYKSDENRRDWTGRQGICVGRAGLCVNN